MSGKLTIVATPLGHLDDASPRCLAALREADRIACEDTRRTSRLLERFRIDTPTVSCHRFNERRRLDELLDRLRAGEVLALVSDAGTPGIADPGAILVNAAWEAGIRVEPIPGPNAVATLLSASGFSADRYVFDGFLPHRAGERRRRLRELAGETRTLVLFETPHRILDTLEDLSRILGERPLVLGRELTKQHETILRGPAAALRGDLGDSVRGEITLVIRGRQEGESIPVDEQGQQLRAAFGEELALTDGDRRQALKRVARRLGLSRSEVQRRLDELGSSR